MASDRPRLAFFGGTGGCAGSALAHCLKAGYIVSALARTPQKLHNLLIADYKVPAETIQQYLTIVQGSARDIERVKETLAPSNIPASIVVSGLGGVPKPRFSIPPFVMDDNHVCEKASETILEGLRSLRRAGIIPESQKPLLVVVSSNGLSKIRDVPLALLPYYRYMLTEPHDDKQAMEELIARASTETGPEAPIAGFILVRPTLLFSGAARGLENVRMGWEKHPSALNAGRKEPNSPPAIGYRINRSDVGLWLFEEGIKNGAMWSGRCVTLTY